MFFFWPDLMKLAVEVDLLPEQARAADPTSNDDKFHCYVMYYVRQCLRTIWLEYIDSFIVD